MNTNTERASRIVEPTPQFGKPAWLPGLALAAIALGAFVELAGDVRIGEGFAFDQAVMGAMHHLASPWLTAVMRLITDSGSAPVIIALSLGLGVSWRRRAGGRAEISVLFATLVGSAALGQTLKAIFARPRPHFFLWLTSAGGWSFPSGHTLTAVILGGLLAWLVGQRLSGWQRVVLWTGAALWAGLVGLSRVYLGVHYPSDVLASLAVGSLCLLVALYVYRMNVSQPAT